MGFLSDRYDRPGPGVSKDEPQKRAVPRFFEVFFRKFFNLIKLNLLFAISVVVVFALVLFAGALSRNIFAAALPVVLLFPFLAGLTIVTRNYAREEHAFLLSDFWDAVKSNWKPFLLDGVACYAVYAAMTVAISYYKYQAGINPFFYVPLVICLCFTMLFIWAHFYIPTMIVTFDMKLRVIFRNAFIFSIVGLWRNLLVSVVLGAFLFAFWFLFQLGPLMLIAVFLLLIIFFSFAFFLINFATYPLLKKHMIDPYIKAQEENQEKSPIQESSSIQKSSSEEEDAFFDDDLTR